MRGYFVHGDEIVEVEIGRARAYDALRVAAEKMGRNNYDAGLRAHLKAGRKASTYRYNPTEEHRAVVAMMPRVASGEASVEEAMGLLHEYGVLNQRAKSK